jgi:hypothetical protein
VLGIIKELTHRQYLVDMQRKKVTPTIELNELESMDTRIDHPSESL